MQITWQMWQMWKISITNIKAVVCLNSPGQRNHTGVHAATWKIVPACPGCRTGQAFARGLSLAAPFLHLDRHAPRSPPRSSTGSPETTHDVLPKCETFEDCSGRSAPASNRSLHKGGTRSKTGCSDWDGAVLGTRRKPRLPCAQPNPRNHHHAVGMRGRTSRENLNPH